MVKLHEGDFIKCHDKKDLTRTATHLSEAGVVLSADSETLIITITEDYEDGTGIDDKG